MLETVIDLPYDLRELTRNLVTEDDVPVDNLFAAKQRRLLVEPLYSSWQPPPIENEAEPRHFLADSDVGIFISPYQPPLAPDMFLSLDVAPNPEYLADEHRSYFVWEYGKAPEVAVEIVSNRIGKEMDDKLRRYAQMGIGYYVVFDPFRVLLEEPLLVHEVIFGGRRYRRRPDFALPELKLSLQLWHGEFEGIADEWLRWCDAEGNLIPTGAERAKAETNRANQAEAELKKLRAELNRLKKAKKK